MAACELHAELKYRDGRTKEVVVSCEKNLQSVLSAVRAVNADVSALLTELVVQEKGAAGNGEEPLQLDDDEDDDDDDEESDEEGAKTKGTTEPPFKRSKIVRA
ncbi:hypothetical protein GN956_G10482 [Arapaima gigas]